MQAGCSQCRCHPCLEGRRTLQEQDCRTLGRVSYFLFWSPKGEPGQNLALVFRIEAGLEYESFNLFFTSWSLTCCTGEKTTQGARGSWVFASRCWCLLSSAWALHARLGFGTLSSVLHFCTCPFWWLLEWALGALWLSEVEQSGVNQIISGFWWCVSQPQLSMGCFYCASWCQNGIFQC